MKNLIFINGTMGAGKTATCKELLKHLPHAVFLDGDNLWDMHPFIVNEETKAMVMDNITHTLNNFLACSEYENIIFCWVMHRESITTDLLAGIHESYDHFYKFTLTLNEETLKKRIARDVEMHKRQEGDFKRSADRLALYDEQDTIKINTNGKTILKVATEIKEHIKHTMNIKPHHFLDIFKNYGRGIEELKPDSYLHHDFYKLGNIILKDPHSRIRLTVNADDICLPCVKCKHHVCTDEIATIPGFVERNTYNHVIDERIIKIMHLSIDEAYDALDLLKTMVEYADEIFNIYLEEEDEKTAKRYEDFVKGAKKYIAKYES